MNDGASGAHSLQPMKIIDRYIGTQFAGPFLVGVAAFVAILLGVGPVFDAARLVVRDGFPLTLVLQVFLLQIPSVIALTLPMGTVFAALMGSGELSSHGEIVAMRAGGVSIWRLATPVVLAGMCITILAFLFNEAIGPVSSAKASAMLREYVLTTRDINEPMVLRVPDRGEAKLLVYADRLSVREGRMSNVTIIEFKGKRAPDLYFAESAHWDGRQWVMRNAQHRWMTEKGYAEVVSETARAPIGKGPEEIRAGGKRKPEEYTLHQLQAEIKRLADPENAPADNRNLRLTFIQHLHLRFAVPWAALCFAILGFPLGMRPQRTSTGVGFGISLAIVFVYYIVFNVLRAFGEQGAISPLVAAWLPNAVVLSVGLGLMYDASR